MGYRHGGGIALVLSGQKFISQCARGRDVRLGISHAREYGG